MKNTIKQTANKLMALGLVLALGSNSVAQTRPASPTPSPVRTQEGPVVEIEDNLVAQQIQIEDAVAEVDESTKVLEIRTKQGYRYLFSMRPEGELAEQLYSRLSEKDRERFQKNRLFSLSIAARALGATKMVAGFGSLVANNLTYIYKRRKAANHPIQALKIGKPKVKLETTPITKNAISERGQVLISATLASLDKTLWEQSPIVANQNEWAASASIGVGTFTKYKTFGYSVSGGITFGFNSDHKGVVFEIFGEGEKMEKAIFVPFMIGLVPKVGIDLRQQVAGQETDRRRGYSFYPPMLPGYTTTTPKSFTAGMNIGLLSYPPSPFSDSFTYLNNSTRVVALRVVIPPIWKKGAKVIWRSAWSKPESDGSIGHLFADILTEIRLRYNAIKNKNISSKVEFDLPQPIQSECQRILAPTQNLEPAEYLVRDAG